MNGKNNIAIGFLTMGAFMAYGFLLIYLRDFAPGKAEWVNSYSTGKHFESRLAHVHGNLFAFLNILIGYLLLRFKGYFLACPNGVTDADWYFIRSIFWPSSCFSVNRRYCHDSFCNMAGYFFL